MQTYTVEISGLTAILMHNGRTANPMDSFVRAMKATTSKRGKTEDDFEALAKYEFYAGLYTDPAIECNKESGEIVIEKGAKLCILAHVLDSNIRKGAMKHKEGKAAAAGCLVEGDGQFFYNGNKSAIPDDWEKFAHICAVKVGSARVMRCRPRFENWSVKFTACLDETVCDKAQLARWMDSAGKLVGIGDWRPEKGGSFGRYTATVS